MSTAEWCRISLNALVSGKSSEASIHGSWVSVTHAMSVYNIQFVPMATDSISGEE